MTLKNRLMARIYLMEDTHPVDEIIAFFREQAPVNGLTVLRGIAGIGHDRKLHTSSLLTLSLELPLVIEFYDEPEKVQNAIRQIKTRFDLPHIVSWPITCYCD
jgi:PII-like signaling protein